MKKESFKYIDDLFTRYPNLAPVKESLINSINILLEMYNKGGKVLVCGNGGSYADSQHIVGELLKTFNKVRSANSEFVSKLNDSVLGSKLIDAIPAISLGSDTGYLTAFSNDDDYAYAFAQQVYTLGKENDVLICLSTSGNSKSCVNAAKVARAKGMKIISLTGINNSKLSELSSETIKAPSDVTHIVQEAHLPIYHTICLVLEEELF